jgi:hypothetical protein
MTDDRAGGLLPKIKQVEPNQYEQQVTAEDIYPVEIPDGTACRNIRYWPHWIVGRRKIQIKMWLAISVLLFAGVIFGLVLNVLTPNAPGWFSIGVLIFVMVFGFAELIFG